MDKEKKFEELCINRKWTIYKIPELPNIKTPDFFVIANNFPFIVEVKNLEESGPERKDIEKIEFNGEVKGQSGDMWKEVDSVARKIDEANNQFKSTKSFNIPQVVIIYSDRQFVPVDRDIVLPAMYGKVFPRLLIKELANEVKKNYLNLPPLITDRTLRKDKNSLISAVGFPFKTNGIYLIHNLWSDIILPTSVFNNENDINYVPQGIEFNEIKFK